MRVSCYEYSCGGGLAGQAVRASLLQSEGWAMLMAVVARLFAAVPGVAVTTLLDERWTVLGRGGLGAGNAARLDREREDALLRTGLNADFTPVIAPEFDDLLVLTRVRRHRSHREAVGSSLAAVHTDRRQVAPGELCVDDGARDTSAPFW